MTAKSPERELTQIHKALGDGLDAKLWPKRLSAPAAVQRLVNLVTESDHVATITRLEEQVRELELERDTLNHASSQHVEQSKQTRFDMETAQQRAKTLEANLETMRQRLEDETKAHTGTREKLSIARKERDDYQQQWQEELDRSARLEQALADARAESVLALADRAREVVTGLRERVKAKLGRA